MKGNWRDFKSVVSQIVNLVNHVILCNWGVFNNIIYQSNQSKIREIVQKN